jgi:hypothetical protein
MNSSSEGRPPQSSDAPYGTEPRRSAAPLVILSIVYGLWFLFLLWMAIFRAGGY